MTRKEFIKGMDEVFKFMEGYNFNFHTCLIVQSEFNKNTLRAYSVFIKGFTESILGQLIICPKIAKGDERPLLRMLLLQSFKEEVLSTKKYLEF